MAAMRAASHALTDADLAPSWADDEQRTRALASLVADGLAVVEQGENGPAHRLPGGALATPRTGQPA
ncbi:hypothetical protein ICW40_05835 [Actinotalea ferrariae]|nr:hypothetical protein [Actinotalea ferrariae]